MMQRALRPSALVPRGFDVESAFCDGATTVITVRPTSGESLCPGCGAGSQADPQSLSPPRRGLAPGGSAGSPRRGGASFPLRG